MCGLVGIAGGIFPQDLKVLRDLLVMDSLRGVHSTGVYAVPTPMMKDQRGLIYKDSVDPWTFFDDPAWRDELFKPNWKVMMGHNRYATQGAINSDNAHPFEHGNIVGAHNGTLVNQSLLPDSNLFEVDSENIMYSVNKIGLKETVAKLHGAYALTLWDKAKEELTFVRNSQRPFHFAVCQTGRTLYWASEKYILLAALDRNKIRHKEIVSLPVHQSYTFKVTGHVKEAMTPEVTKLDHYVPPVPAYNYNDKWWKKSSAPWKPLAERANECLGKEIKVTPYSLCTIDGQSFYRANVSHKEGDVPARIPASDSDNVVLHETYLAKAKVLTNTKKGLWLVIDETSLKEESNVLYLVNNDELVTEDEFHKRTKHGCSWCTGVVDAEEAPNIKWINHNTFLCPDCTEYSHQCFG